MKLALLPIGYEYMSRHPYVEELCGLPLVNVRRVPLDNAGADIVKRLLIFSRVLFSLFSSPVMLVAAIGTRLSSPGPVLFRQERIGKDKKPFLYAQISLHARERAVGHGVDARPRPAPHGGGGRSCGDTPSTSCRSSLTSLRAICRSSARGRRSRGMSIISNTAFRFIWCAIRCAPASPAGHRSTVCAAIPPSARGWITISIISKTGRCCLISRSCL